MKQHEVTVPQIGLIAGTRAMLGAGIALLLSEKLSDEQRRAIGWTLVAVGDWRLTDCDLYVTKEPCAMCAGAVVHTRIRRVIFGCEDPSAGAAGSMMNLLQMQSFNHRCEITYGLLQKECATILQEFFRKRREGSDG